ncbi:hypothetical protein YC2023_101192 [Brassica napus]
MIKIDERVSLSAAGDGYIAKVTSTKETLMIHLYREKKSYRLHLQPHESNCVPSQSLMIEKWGTHTCKEGAYPTF